MTDNIRHAYFSQKQKELNILKQNREKKYHTNIYLTTDGNEVEITEVSKNYINHKKNFPDSIYLGKVVKWLRPKYL